MASCYRHPNRETAVSCSNCGRPICPDCMTTSPVGMRCPECARQTTKVTNMRAVVRHGYEATRVLIAINVIAFLAEGSSAYTFSSVTNNSWLLNHGLLWSPYVRSTNAFQGVPDQEFYRLITSGFLHLNIIHILSNMYVLFWVGRLLEPAIGRNRFVAIYFTGLLAGSLGVLLVSPHNPTAGASGAIFGLLGAAFTEAQRRGVDQVRNQLLILIAINLALTLSLPDISIGAHLGGLIGGGLATLGFQQGDRLRLRWLGWAACLALAVIAVAGSIIAANNVTFN